METLLKIGDMIKIREDIDISSTKYKMKIDPLAEDTYTKSMIEPGTFVTISKIVLCQGHYKYKIKEDPIMNYVDEMFDPLLIEYLYKQIQ